MFALLLVQGHVCEGAGPSALQLRGSQGRDKHRAVPASPVDAKGHPADLDVHFTLWGCHSPLCVVMCLATVRVHLFHFGLKLINQGDFGERNNSFLRICIILGGDMIMVFVKDRTQ